MKLQIFLLLFCLPAIALRSQNLAEAKRLSETGRHREAQKIYDAVLANDPGNLEALIGAGYNHSWARQNDEAREKFEAALAVDPRNPLALAGQGYNLAWSGRYAAARLPFQTLESLQPGSAEARKGQGYICLWEGRHRAAIDYFEKLVLEYPENIEYYVALAQSYLAEHDARKARIALRSALQIAPANRAARELLNSARGAAAPLELDVWAGYSRTGGMGSFNLRNVQFTGQVAKKLRMFLKYDNSLTLDLASLLRSNRDAQAFSAGAVVPSNSRLTSRFEYGARFLPGDATQQVFSTEQVYFLRNLSFKAGGFLGWSSKISNEWLAYGSVRIPVLPYYAVEPYFFHSRVDNAPRPENRFLLNNQFRTQNGYELNLGAFFGKAGVGREVANDNVYGGYATALLPFSRTVWGQLSLRWEKAPFDELTAFAAGIKLRLEK